MNEETERIEFKTSTAEIPAAINSIVAILNKHQKGTLYFLGKKRWDSSGSTNGRKYSKSYA